MSTNGDDKDAVSHDTDHENNGEDDRYDVCFRTIAVWQVVLLRAVGIVEGAVECLRDGRKARRVRHFRSMESQSARRVCDVTYDRDTHEKWRHESVSRVSEPTSAKWRTPTLHERLENAS